MPTRSLTACFPRCFGCFAASRMWSRRVSSTATPPFYLRSGNLYFHRCFTVIPNAGLFPLAYVSRGSCVGARYEHYSITSSASSTRLSRRSEQSNARCRAEQQFRRFRQCRGGSGRSERPACGVVFRAKLQQFAANRHIAGRRQPELGRYKGLTSVDYRFWVGPVAIRLSTSAMGQSQT